MMRASLGLVFWMAALRFGVVVEAANSCVECHQQFESGASAPTQVMAHDVHIQRGLSCSDCHGGDPAATEATSAMDPAKGFIGRPARAEIPQFCARCHADPAYMRKYNPNLPTDQYAKYLTSQHGKRLGSGDADVAVCTSCHGAHGIRSKKDPQSPVYAMNIPGTCAVCHTNARLMERHGLPTNQYADYSQSVHGQALLVRGDRAAPHCASCHGSHEASRPKVVAIGNICAQCHGLTRDLFTKSPHKRAHEVLGLPECEVCHGNHLIRKPTDEMLGTGSDAVCVNCHEPGSAGYVTAQQMREAIERLNTQMTGAQVTVAQAAQLGMEVADAEFALNQATAQLTQARTYVHSFSASTMEPIAEEGIRYARQAETQGQQAIHEFGFRRHGLWMTLAILFLVVGGLALFIRDLERPNSSGKQDPPAPPHGPA
ncbi:MAG: cytochrome c3 family protein [Candidatus Omnitrophica bacterium]|nr:cytochrome c3 family protein [Candidatus Omnitrophota bacterium]